MRHVVISGVALVLSACAVLQPVPEQGEVSGEAFSDGVTTDILVRPRARPDGFSVEAAEELADDAGGAETGAPASGPLGTTVASLGNPAEPGLWLKTPLVRKEQSGQVRYPETGKSTQVTLIPLDGPATAGSQLSLSAMQAIGAPLTGLPTIEVSAGA